MKATILALFLGVAAVAVATDVGFRSPATVEVSPADFNPRTVQVHRPLADQIQKAMASSDLSEISGFLQTAVEMHHARANGTRAAFSDEMSSDIFLIIGFLDFLDQKVMSDLREQLKGNEDFEVRLQKVAKDYTRFKTAMVEAGGKYNTGVEVYNEVAGEREARMPVIDKEINLLRAQNKMLGEFAETLEKFKGLRSDEAAANAAYVEGEAYNEDVDKAVNGGSLMLLQKQVETLHTAVQKRENAKNTLSQNNELAEEIDFDNMEHEAPKSIHLAAPKAMATDDEAGEATHHLEKAVEKGDYSFTKAEKGKMYSSDGEGLSTNYLSSHEKQIAQIEAAVMRLKNKLMEQLADAIKEKTELEERYKQAYRDMETAKGAYGEAINDFKQSKSEYSALKLIAYNIGVIQEEMDHLRTLREKIMMLLSVGTVCSGEKLNGQEMGSVGQFNRAPDGEDPENWCYAVFTSEEAIKIMDESVARLNGGVKDGIVHLDSSGGTDKSSPDTEGQSEYDASGNRNAAHDMRDSYVTPDTEIVDLLDMFDGGRSVCRHWGGELVSIHTQDENDYVKKLGHEHKQKHKQLHKLVIGFDDFMKMGSNNIMDRWAWSDGTSFDWDVSTNPTERKFGNFARWVDGYRPFWWNPKRHELKKGGPRRRYLGLTQAYDWVCMAPEKQASLTGLEDGQGSGATDSASGDSATPVAAFPQEKMCKMQRYPGECTKRNEFHGGVMMLSDHKPELDGKWQVECLLRMYSQENERGFGVACKRPIIDVEAYLTAGNSQDASGAGSSGEAAPAPAAGN